jgi:hypothetical protein
MTAPSFLKATLTRRSGSLMSAAASALCRSTSAPRCEANALVVEPEVGRALCRDAILEHIPPMPWSATSTSSIACASGCAEHYGSA